MRKAKTIWSFIFIVLVGFDQITLAVRLRKHTLSAMCNIETIGYKPTKRKVQVGSVQSPVVTHQKDYVKTFAGKGVLIANGAMHSSNVINGLKIYENAGTKAIKNFAKYAPVFASSLGVLGVIFGVIVDNLKPTIAELIERTNKLFENFAKEVNLRLDQMKGYVDTELVQLEKRLGTEDYQDISSTWIGCAELYKSDIYICQTMAMLKMLAQENRFLKNNENLMAADDDTVMPEQTVRIMEANFPTFANYAFLVLTNLDVLASTYESKKNEKEKHNLRLYSQSFVDFLTKFKRYAEKAIVQFKKLHTINTCEQTFQCISSEEPSTHPKNSRHNEVVTRCSCKFDPTLPAGHCEYSVRAFMPYYGGWTNEYRESSESAETIGRRRVLAKSKEYQNAIEAKIVSEWKKNVLDLEEWDSAKTLREKILGELDEEEGSGD